MPTLVNQPRQIRGVHFVAKVVAILAVNINMLTYYTSKQSIDTSKQSIHVSGPLKAHTTPSIDVATVSAMQFSCAPYHSMAHDGAPTDAGPPHKQHCM